MIDFTPFVNINNMSQINFKTLMLFRCTTQEYANSFIERGNIRFGLPKEWIEEGKKHGRGRGDLLEGAFAAIKELDERPITFYKLIRPNVIMNRDPINNFYYFQSEDVLNMRTFCLFGLNDNLFSTRLRNQYHQLAPTGKISKKYFEDFFPNVTADNYDSLESRNKPVLLMISNPHAFFERIRGYFHKLGLKDNEFIIAPVRYIDMSMQFFINDPLPNELFAKDSYYKRQSEVRILINSTRKNIVEKLNRCNGIVDIGPMNDIADYQEYYFDDFHMQLQNNAILFTLPKPIETTIDDPVTFIHYVHQALRDELPEAPMSIEDIEKFIDPIIKILDIHYDILFYRDAHIFSKKDGSQSWDLSDVWDTLFLHGLNYFNEKEYEKSIDSFSKAINFESSRSEAWYNRACCLYFLNRYDEMFADMDEAIKRDPTNQKYSAERESLIQKISASRG